MSYNLAFWAGGGDPDPAALYKRLNRSEHVDGVDVVDRDRVVQAFADELVGWGWDGQILLPPEVEAGGTPAFDVSIGGQMVECIGYDFEGKHANAIIDVMLTLGLRLFDPQTGARFG